MKLAALLNVLAQWSLETKNQNKLVKEILLTYLESRCPEDMTSRSTEQLIEYCRDDIKLLQHSNKPELVEGYYYSVMVNKVIDTLGKQEKSLAGATKYEKADFLKAVKSLFSFCRSMPEFESLESKLFFALAEISSKYPPDNLDLAIVTDIGKIRIILSFPISFESLKAASTNLYVQQLRMMVTNCYKYASTEELILFLSTINEVIGRGTPEEKAGISECHKTFESLLSLLRATDFSKTKAIEIYIGLIKKLIDYIRENKERENGYQLLAMCVRKLLFDFEDNLLISAFNNPFNYYTVAGACVHVRHAPFPAISQDLNNQNLLTKCEEFQNKSVPTVSATHVVQSGMFSAPVPKQSSSPSVPKQTPLVEEEDEKLSSENSEKLNSCLAHWSPFKAMKAAMDTGAAFWEYHKAENTVVCRKRAISCKNEQYENYQSSVRDALSTVVTNPQDVSLVALSRTPNAYRITIQNADKYLSLGPTKSESKEETPQKPFFNYSKIFG